jgi:DNA-binding GntR family transcriptional regulator
MQYGIHHGTVRTQLASEPPIRMLRAEVRQALRDRIVDGRLAPGVNLVERELSTGLHVSRTPVREALLALQAEGLVRAEPQRGFFVAGLSVHEARELYTLLGALEAIAVERGRPAPSAALEAVNRRFSRATARAGAVELDREWHERLIRLCGLPRTAAIAEVLRTAVARYEYQFFSGPGVIAESARQHESIMRAIEGRRYHTAAALVRRNWEKGLGWVERWFAGR